MRRENAMACHGPDSKAVVWARNSHVGDAAATEMVVRGESEKVAFGAIVTI